MSPISNPRQVDIILSMGKNERPVTIMEMQELHSVAYQTARSDLLDLAEQGYLQKITKGKQFIFIINKSKCLGAA